MAVVTQGAETAVSRLDVSVYTVPTDTPESDGTFEWDSVTLILVEAHAGDCIGLGWTYGAPATAKLIKEELALLAPLPAHERPMPAQQRPRRDQKPARRPRQMAGRSGKQGAISRPKLRPPHLTTQNLELVTDHHQLDVLHIRTATTANKQAEQRQRDRGRRRTCRRSSQSSPTEVRPE